MAGRAASRSWRWAVVFSVAAGALLMVGPAAAYGVVVPHATAATPQAMNSGPTVDPYTTWAGHGVRGPPTAKITSVNASWIQPAVNCSS